MRIFHTSDWHLGQHFLNKSREHEHAAFIDWLIGEIESRQPDALIIAGDIFDTGTPPSYARTLYNNFIARMAKTGCQLLILGGNHDSVATLHESRGLMQAFNTRVIGGADTDPAQHVCMLNTRDGSPGALVCAVPYLRPIDIMRSQAGESAQAKRLALLETIQNFYTVIYKEAQAQQANLKAEQGIELPIIATGHLTTVGGQMSESVRELYIGTLDAVPASALPPADYIALGHLHRPQKVGGNEHIRYSGSPIALSFDEIKQQKELLEVCFTDGERTIEALPVPCFQPLARIAAPLNELESRIISQCANLSDEQRLWLEIEVEGDDLAADLQQQIQAITDPHPVEVLKVRRKRNRAASLGGSQQTREGLDELSPEDVFQRRLSQTELDDEQAATLTTAFKSLCAELKEEQA